MYKKLNLHWNTIRRIGRLNEQVPQFTHKFSSTASIQEASQIAEKIN
jgi:hypothetical protein